MKAKILIPVGFGLNCEDETEHAFRMVGADVKKVHVNDLLSKPDMLEDCQLIALVGGFSFGDHIASGKVLANIYRFNLGGELQNFIKNGKLIFGECNGFQTMVKLGILPGINNDYRTQTVTLMNNDSGRFEDRWVSLHVNPDSKCVFTKGIEKMYLPVRHGEGKFVTKDISVLDHLREKNQIVMKYTDENTGKPTMTYPQNPNGSADSIAGICDETGRVFGLMPHPTAYLSPYNHPCWTRLKAEEKLPEEGGGVQIFRNAVEYIDNNF